MIIPDRISNLVKASLQNTSAHGVARLVNEKQLYIRILWLTTWLVMCGFFLWYFVRFAKKLQAKDVTTNIKADSVPFEFPDLYFCYNNLMSGSRHMSLSKESAAFINSSFQRSVKWCRETGIEMCAVGNDEAAEVQINSLPFRFLADNMAHVMEQSIMEPLIFRTNGLFYRVSNLIVTEFYHPTHLTCFKAAVNKTDMGKRRFTSANEKLSISLMMDAPDSHLEKGLSQLPVVKKRRINLTSPYWAFDRLSLYYGVRESKIAMYITQPEHYPSSFDSVVVLEAGRTYTMQLEMKEKVHNQDTSRCIDKHPDVQMVNPYDNSPYTVKYNYAFCYNSAVQAQFKRELNATCPFLPHPWPPADHSLYNLSSGWGSAQDVQNYFLSKRSLRSEEPFEKCAAMHPCSERSYTPIVESVLWPSPDAIESVLDNLDLLNNSLYPYAPALMHLRALWANRENASQQLINYVRLNFLQLLVSARRPMTDQIIFTRAYSFESFVADVGGILGIYLGMSLLTAFELAQFFHDLTVVLLCSTREQTQSPVS